MSYFVGSWGLGLGFGCDAISGGSSKSSDEEEEDEGCLLLARGFAPPNICTAPAGSYDQNGQRLTL